MFILKKKYFLLIENTKDIDPKYHKKKKQIYNNL